MYPSFFTYQFSTVLNVLASYGLLIFLLRILPKTDYGQYGVYVSVFSMVMIFFNFGHKEVVFKYASKTLHDGYENRLSRVFESFWRWNITMLLAVQCLLLINLTLYLVALTFLINSWLLTAMAYHRGIANYKWDAFALPMQRTLWLFLCVLWFFIEKNIGLVAIFASSLTATAICITWLYVPILSRIPIGILKNNQEKTTNKLLIKYLVIEFASVFYLKSDVLLLRYFNFKMDDIANYFFAIQVFEFAVLVILPLGYFYFNRLGRNQGSSDRVVSTAETIKYLSLMFGLIGLMHACVWFFAPLIFPLMIPQYTASINVVLLVMFSLYPVAANVLLSSQLIIANNEATYVKVSIIALFFNILVNSSLIPVIGLNGVILAKFFTELLITVMLLRLIR